jgi:hypothetical protein
MSGTSPDWMYYGSNWGNQLITERIKSDYLW